ncbi:winged helix DNA-binding domain-containing protein [Nocardia asteroides]|uniref:winged helix DNA-binding domain-containing protein n=1 Tax=Nocardia asteroides TaxID=1824 RepID=UPI001E5F16A1|nr:winged helix DNA-binding domain-containing protein [Nocardia asteroides]UGT63743.1 winged helix DNA-binding domain-containing protein [Nocardia asteroides]
MPDLSLRALNRTLLTRQHLIEPAPLTPAALIEELVAVQGQEPNWPYLGLWNRLRRFDRADLAAALIAGEVVRSTTLRRTVHLTTAADFRWLRPTLHELVAGAVRSAYYRDELDGIDHAALAAAGRELLGDRLLTRGELGTALAERFPERHVRRLAEAVEVMVPLVHGPECGEWGRWRNRYVTVGLAEARLGPLAPAPEPATLVRRYLAAFGPATVADAQAWSGATRLAPVFAALRPELRVLRDPDGRELFDLPDAVLADPETPVPVRFLPAFDNAVLGYRDRRRIVSEADRRRTAAEASAGVPVYLVDGFVHGRWSLAGSTLRVEPWHPIGNSDDAAIREEAERTLKFLIPYGEAAISIVR